MSYNDRRFSEAVELLQQLDFDTGSRDKRRAQRAVIRTMVGVKLNMSDETEPWKKYEMRDLSPRGLSIAFNRVLEDGLSFLVQLPCEPGRTQSSPLICQVVHCDIQRDGICIIGAEFTGRAAKNHSKNNTDEEDRIRIGRA